MAATLSPQQTQVARMLYGLGRSRGLSHQRALEFVAAAYSESGLRRDARNPTSGAEGEYQLLSSGYRQRAQALGGLDNPRANALAILPEYLSYWKSHPGAAPGAGGAAVEASGEGAGFYSKGLGLVSQAVGQGGAPASQHAAGMPAPLAPATAPPPVDTSALRQQALQSLIGQVGQKTPDYTDFLGGLQAVKTAETQTPVAAPAATTPRTVTPSAPRANPGPLEILGKSPAREAPSFLTSLYKALRAAGATKVRFISTDRPAAYNAQVGGVSHSNHIPDASGHAHAADAQAFVPGKGWIPLGVLLRATAGKYGLRSGDVPGFYRGGPDVNHVDDGANQR